MSSPASSPSSSGSRSQSNSPAAISHAPKSSVQALLNELSDSDHENVETVPHRNVSRNQSSSPVPDADESSDDDIVMGRGRLAARLQGDVSVVQQDMVTTSKHAEEPSSIAPGPTRKLLLKRKRTSADQDGESSPKIIRPRRSASGSPTPSPKNGSPVSESSDSTAIDTQKEVEVPGRGRFAELVEKKRAERLAREEEQRAKQAAKLAEQQVLHDERRVQRGSSVADDSDEDSDQEGVAAARKLTKDARPTRKASKKALEEMHRETQRMNRSLQLSHQTLTKKKFTMKGFFDKFNRTGTEQTQATSSSPIPSSDSEHLQEVQTPPTSPMLASFDADKQPTQQIATTVQAQPLADNIDDQIDFLEYLTVRRDQSLKDAGPAFASSKQPAVTETVMRASTIADPDSDTDIEVVFDTAQQRKFVAFERLPKRKAKETASHLALRGLAQVKIEKSKKSKMSAVTMAQSLRDAARKQASEERKAKIEQLRARGITFQTAEERDAAEEEVEDILEKARLEEVEIRKREKQLAKKNGTYVQELDDEDSDEEDSDFAGDDEAESGSEDENDDQQPDDEGEEAASDTDGLIAPDALLDEAAELSEDDELSIQVKSTAPEMAPETPMQSARRNLRRVVDEDDDDDSLTITNREIQVPQSPALPSARKTPQSIMRSARKVIPGLQHSDDLPLGLTQAFAATMADSQTQEDQASQGPGDIDSLQDMPSPNIRIQPKLSRLDSLDVISESILGSQTQQPFDGVLGLSQQIPESPALDGGFDDGQTFDLTQDAGYSFSPFKGNRFAETPNRAPKSTEDTIILENHEESPMVKRSKLRRGRQVDDEKAEDDEEGATDNLGNPASAFQKMSRAARRNKLEEAFNKKKSEARQAFDEAAEESDDEYAGLGGASDDESGEENEADREMIDEDTQIGIGDEAALAKLHADREREADEQLVSKMYKDITTGALRRKRGVGDDLDDLSDEDEAAARRRKAKQREFAKMRRELLKDEAVGKIAEDKRKAAFLKSIEDQDEEDEDETEVLQPQSQLPDESQSQEADQSSSSGPQSRPLQPADVSKLNANARRVQHTSRKPGTLAEIRESVSFLIEEPDSHAATIDLGLSDSEDDQEAYVDLDRHIAQAEADENDDEENEGLADFIIDDEPTFKKPSQPIIQDRAPFSERRTKPAVVDRLSLMRQQSSSSSSNAQTRQAFTSRSSTSFSVPSLLRRATTNSSLKGDMSNTGVVTRAERGTGQDKEFVRKGSNTSRNAINYQGRQNLKEEKMSARAGVVKKQQQNRKKANGGFLQGLFGGNNSWA